MKEFLGRIKADFLLSSVLCIALGLVFIIWRASVLTIVANVLAVVLIIIGVVYMCSYFLNIVTNGFSAMLGLVVLAVGIWFLVQPKVVVSLIPIVIGLVLIFHSIRSIIEAVDATRRSSDPSGCQKIRLRRLECRLDFFNNQSDFWNNLRDKCI